MRFVQTLVILLAALLWAPPAAEAQRVRLPPIYISDLADSQGHVSVVRYGAAPNDAVDDTAAFQAAVDFVSGGGGGIVWVPRGTFIVQGVALPQGVQIRGAGASHDVGGTSATILRLPASPAAGVAMFYLHNSVGEYFDGGALADLECNGGLYSEAASMPTAPTTTVESLQLRALDLRQGVKYTISGVDPSTDIVTTSAAHGFVTARPVNVTVGSGGTLPAGLSGQPSYYYVRADSATTCSFYTSAAYATAGGATGRVNITDVGAGTFYVSRTIGGVTHFAIERCYFHHFDEAVRMSSIIDRCLTFYTHFRYCYVGFQGQEHPKFIDADFRFCYFGLTGRFVDMLLDDGNKFASNYYAVGPYDTVGAGGTSYLGNSGSTYFVNNCVLSGLYFGNVVAITCSANCVVPPHTYIDGGLVDVGVLPLSKSIGVRVQGANNRVSGMYGQGTSNTTFAIAAILLDNASGAAGVGNVIDGATFNLVSGVAGNCAIGGGNTKLSTPLFGGGAYGAIGRFAVQNCTAKLAGLRFLYFAPSNGSSSYTSIRGNSVEFVSGGTNTIGASDGIIEGGWYTATEFADNRVYRVSGTVGSAIEQTTVASTSVRYERNRFDGGSWSQAVITFNGGPTTCVIRDNAGFTTEFAGTAVLNGTTNVNVPHGMALAPPLANVQITAQADVGAVTPLVVSADATNIVIKASGASTGTVNVRASYSP